MIYMDVDFSPVNNIYVVPEPQKKSGCNTEIDHRSEVSDGVQDYILLRDRKHHSTKP